MRLQMRVTCAAIDADAAASRLYEASKPYGSAREALH